MYHTNKAGRQIDDFKIIKKIGRGSFGDIYYVIDINSNLYYAMKLEKNKADKKKFLNTEQKVYKKIGQSVYFPELVKYGHTHYYNYLVMECFGQSIEKLCQNNSENHLSLSTSLRFSIEMLRCIHEFHNNKFIHRDIKPANFVIRKSKQNPIVLIDFGLSRQYINQDGELIRPRERPGYVGTNMFASTGAYCGLELSQRDDLFSWFYSVIKICTGNLPWDQTDDRNKTFNLKIYTTIEQLTMKMPKQFKIIYDHIICLAVNEIPNYSMIIDLITQAMNENGCSWEDPYDWETMSNHNKEKMSLIPNTPHDGTVSNENRKKTQESLSKNSQICCNIE